MTRLFNLESYPELCSYAQLYNQELSNLIPQSDSFPSDYKVFLHTCSEQSYFADSPNCQNLTFRDEFIQHNNVYIDLPGDTPKIYIVPDKSDLLTLRSFLKPGESYIYKSAYHYWNYLGQITNHVELSKPVIFIDLNTLTESQSCQIQFFHPQNSPYPVPVLDIKNDLQNLKTNLFRDIYQRICFQLAQSIIQENFVKAADEAMVKHLASYLQKVRIFQMIQSHISQNDFFIFIEILYNGKIYYKSVNLNISEIEDIVLRQIDYQSIKQLASQHQEFSFIVISDYNILPKFRNSLNYNNIFVPDTSKSQFEQIWLQKKKNSFPLFGHYLEQIEFQIGKDRETQWIKVLSQEEGAHIYYEGQTETKQFIGRIQETGQNYFTLPYPYAILPIRINGQDYCVNGIPQGYFIKNPLEESKAQSERLQVQIEFLLRPGSAPELSVTSTDNKYRIETKIESLPQGSYYNFIPRKLIFEKRQQESLYIPNQEKCRIIVEALSQLQNRQSQLYNSSSLERITEIKTYIDTAYRQINLSRGNVDLLLNVNPNHPSLATLRESLDDSTLAELINIVLNYLKGNQKDVTVQSAINRFVIFLGKTYRFSENLSLKSFFDKNNLKLGVKKIAPGEYFKFLSRVAIKKEFQNIYLNCFFDFVDKTQPFYQKDSYLWGYGRILVWYSNFDYTTNEFDYLSHFQAILKYLIDKHELQQERFQEYRRNAFLSLIYLLTFRELDKNFCISASKEFQLSEKVVDLYKKYPVYLRRISSDKSLNDYFEELLHGNSSMEAVSKLLQVD